MYLSKYDIIKKLGKGSYGTVHLVQNKNQQQFAMKLISLEQNKEPYLRALIQGQIKCMQEINSSYFVKLIEYHQDEKWLYIIMEYCQGGDLLFYQARQKEMVFSLEKAVEMLSDVLCGLEDLHRQGYVHRDVKSQNVLVKYEDGKQIVKLADFGLSKKSMNVTGTILGTCEYMSPELLRGEKYGFEVDMWSFGVLFYFMLNGEQPFKFKSSLSQEQRAQELSRMAAKFSYRQAVGRSQKKRVQNCTDEVEDLFRRIFQVDREKRINFYQIRRHPVFSAMFSLPEQLKSFYHNKQSEQLFDLDLGSRLPQTFSEQHERSQDATPELSRTYLEAGIFEQEVKVLQSKRDEIEVLKLNYQTFANCGSALKLEEKLMVCYSLLKYYLILLKQFRQALTCQHLTQQHPGLQWQEFLESSRCEEFKEEVESEIKHSFIKYTNIYHQCNLMLKQILQLNSTFGKGFTFHLDVTDFVDPFKATYRSSTSYVYKVLRSKYDRHRNGNKIGFLLTLVVISHAYNRLFENRQLLASIFKPLNQAGCELQFGKLRQRLSTSRNSVLAGLIKDIIKQLF